MSPTKIGPEWVALSVEAQSGGFSGGAKRSAVLGAMLARTGSIRIVGFLLSGINEDRLSEPYRTYSPGEDFLNIPV